MQTFYYDYLKAFYKAFGANCKSIINIGKIDGGVIEGLEWIEEKYFVGTDSLLFEAETKGVRYDLASCTGILYQHHEPENVVQGLFEISGRVIISVPSAEGNVEKSLEEVISWALREPDYYVTVNEPFSSDKWIICYYGDLSDAAPINYSFCDKYAEFLLKAFGADCGSILDTSGRSDEYIKALDWMPTRHMMDLMNPIYTTGIEDGEITETELLDYFTEKYGFALCINRLQSLDNIELLTAMLFQIGDRVMISVPYKSVEGLFIDEEILYAWTGRKPDFEIVVDDVMPNQKWLISYYHSQNKEFSLDSAVGNIIRAEGGTNYRKLSFEENRKYIKANMKRLKKENKRLAKHFEEEEEKQRQLILYTLHRNYPRHEKAVNTVLNQNLQVLRSIPEASVLDDMRKLNQQVEMLGRKVLQIEEADRKLNGRLDRLNSKTADEKAADNRVSQIMTKMLELGFVKRGYTELREIALYSHDLYLKRTAAFKLAGWYVNQENQIKKGFAEVEQDIRGLGLSSTEDFANQALHMIRISEIDENISVRLRKLAILKAESMAMLDDREGGKRVLSEAMKKEEHTDFMLSYANMEIGVYEKLKWINLALKKYGLAPISIAEEVGMKLFDCISCNIEEHCSIDRMPLVTVIVTAYNAEDTIETAMDSIINQTYTNMEIIAVDDCSIDNTADILRGYEERDSRVKVLVSDKNSGTYTCRNIALQMAQGEFITCHDADDWSHPIKIETHVRDLMSNKGIVGNESCAIRMYEDLEVYFTSDSNYIGICAPSFMYRKAEVMEKIGYWDCVRFAADNEFIHRIEMVLGSDKVKMLRVPLTVMRKIGTSLTANRISGADGYRIGVRKNYFDIYMNSHSDNSELKYEFPMETRPFTAPDMMLPEYNANERKHYDIVFAYDYRITNECTREVIAELQACLEGGLNVAVLQMYRYNNNADSLIQKPVQDMINRGEINIVGYGETIYCNLLILRDLSVLENKQKHIAEIKASNSIVVIDTVGRQGKLSLMHDMNYSCKNCINNFKEMFGFLPDSWYPSSGLMKQIIEKYYNNDINISQNIWNSPVDIDDERELDITKSKHVLGLNVCGEYLNKIDEVIEGLSIFSNSADIEIHVIKDTNIRTNIGLGSKKPNNWKLKAINYESKHALVNLDLLIYFNSEDSSEVSERIIIESMALGIPVVLSHSYKDNFGESVVYADDGDIPMMVSRLINNSDFYREQAIKGRKYAVENYAYSQYINRLSEYGILHKEQCINE